jgi:hypothetical protein
MQARELIMDLTNEQGGGRESQVQPPSEVWEQFFGVRVNADVRPTFRLESKRAASEPEQRKVVKHHHNLTLEIGDAKLPRPAILRMRRAGHNAFDYWVYRPTSREYRHCDWILANLADGEAKGRRWIII